MLNKKKAIALTEILEADEAHARTLLTTYGRRKTWN